MLSTILEAVQEWVLDPTLDLEPTTLRRYVYSLGLLVTAGVVALEQLTPEIMLRYLLARRRAGASASTCNRDLAAVSSLCGWLHTRGRFPLAVIHEFREMYFEGLPGPTPDFLVRPRFTQLLEVSERVHPTLALAVDLDVHTGLRLGELRRLWHDDFELHCKHAFVRVNQLHDRPVKTHKDRTSAINRDYADKLISMGIGAGEGPIFPSRKRKGEVVASPYVVEHTFQAWLWKAEAEVGFPVNWLTLRHTFASWHAQENVSLFKIAKWLGNSVMVCFANYAALMPGGDPDCERAFLALKQQGAA